MEIATVRYTHGEWSAPFPALDSARTLVLAFAAPGYRDRAAVLAELAAAYPTSVVVGCSTAGEIEGTQIHDASISVAAIRFATTRVCQAHATLDATSDSRAAGAALAAALLDDELRAVLVLSDGLHTNGSELVRGLNAGLPEHVIVTGGLAADGDRFAQTWVLAGGKPLERAVVAVGLYGDAVRVTHGSEGGWDEFGPTRRVTAATGNVLHMLDGRPALALYREYLGERATGLPGAALLFPLALRDTADHGDSVVRTVLAVDEATQSLRFAGDIPVGHRAQFMRANFDRLILGAQAAAIAAAPTHTGPTLSLAISCVGRRLVLGERTEEEIEVTLEAQTAGATQLGFYSYGEISPRRGGRSDLHNQTMTLTVVSEAA